MAVKYQLTQDGGWQWQVCVSWTEPTSNPLYANVQGYDLVIEYPDGSRSLVTSVSTGISSFTTDWWSVPATPQTYTIWIVPFNQNGQRNTIVTGVTASLTFTVQQPTVSAGIEYTSLVTNLKVRLIGYTVIKGQQTLQIFLTYTPPNDPTFAGVVAYAITPGYPSPGEQLTGITVASPTTFAGILTASLLIETTGVPTSNESWTIYLLSASTTANQVNTYVLGTTPSVTVTVGPKPLGPVGQEYTSLVTGLAASYTYGSATTTTPNASGQQVLLMNVTFTPPSDTTYAGVTLFAITPGYPSPGSQLTGSPGCGPTSTSIPCEIVGFPPSTQSWTIYALSVDANGETNTYAVGTTPSVTLSVSPPALGSSGVEYTSLVTSVSAAITYNQSVDGVETYGFSASWTPPSISTDPTFGGINVIARDHAGVIADQLLFVSGPSDTTLQTDQWPIYTNTPTWDLYFQSFDVNGRTNSIQSGITPEVSGLNPSAQTTGALKGGRISAATLAINAFVSGIRPVVLVTSDPSLPNALYPPGTYEYNITSQSLKRVNAAGTAWIAGVNGGTDIVANSITVGVLAAGVLSASNITAGTITASIGITAATISGSTLTLNFNGATTTVNNGNSTGSSGASGMRVQDNSTSIYTAVTQQGFWVLNSSGVALGQIQNSGGSGFLKVNAPTGSAFCQLNGANGNITAGDSSSNQSIYSAGGATIGFAGSGPFGIIIAGSGGYIEINGNTILTATSLALPSGGSVSINSVTCINSSQQFVGAGVNCNAGVAGTGFNIFGGGSGQSVTVVGTFTIGGIAKTNLVFTGGILTSYS